MVTFASTKNGEQKITSANVNALSLGIIPNQLLTDALAILPELRFYKENTKSILDALTELRATFERYTPWVSIDKHGDLFEGRYSWGVGLWLNITGCSHLFDGEVKLLESIFSLIQRMGYRARAGIASTTGTAWAIARYKTDFNKNPWYILQHDEDIHTAIGNIPTAGLRIDERTVNALRQVGITYIKDLYKIPRATLVRRFNKTILERLEQALGQQEEPISPEKKVPKFTERLLFFEPTSLQKNIETGILKILIILCSDLAKYQKGARRLKLYLYKSDNSITCIRIGSRRAIREPHHLLNLFIQKLENFHFGFEIEAIVIDVSETNELTAKQNKLYPDLNDKRLEGINKLIDKLVSRIGYNNINYLKPLDRHFPELTSKKIPAIAAPHKLKEIWKKNPSSLPRPLKLLVRPIPIDVIALAPDGPPASVFIGKKKLKIALADGPERITPEWWQSNNFLKKTRYMSSNTRDYYRVEDVSGKRYWIYKEGIYQHDKTSKWYIHGFFP